MEKQQLREILSKLTRDEEIQFSTYENPEQFQNHRVLEVKRGKGKGSSLIATVQNTTNNNVTIISTSNNEKVLNVIVNGNFYGYKKPSDDPRVFDEENAANLKAQLKPLVQHPGYSKRLSIKSTDARFNGMFTVKKAVIRKGKFGEIQMFLHPNTSDTEMNKNVELEFLTHRHSAIVQEVQILDNPINPS